MKMGLNHEMHGKHEKGEESAASAVVFLSADGWAWVGLGKPRILREEEEVLTQSRKDAKGRGRWGSEKDEL